LKGYNLLDAFQVLTSEFDYLNLSHHDCASGMEDLGFCYTIGGSVDILRYVQPIGTTVQYHQEKQDICLGSCDGATEVWVQNLDFNSSVQAVTWMVPVPGVGLNTGAVGVTTSEIPTRRQRQWVEPLVSMISAKIDTDILGN